MTALLTKNKMLEDAGYAYSFGRQMYINRRTKKAFSIEFVEDNSEDKIRERINADKQDGAWEFNFNTEPSDSVKRELENVLG
jgi:ABC-type transporter lipoprotein component MlaA